jgi:hypothetical protein
MYEELAMKTPFDGSDAVRSGVEAAIPARSWQHMAARAAMAYVTNGHDLREAFTAKYWPEARRIAFVDELSALINDHRADDGEDISQLIFNRLRQDEAVNIEFDEFVDEDELEQMVEDVGSVIDEIREKAKAG